MPVVMHRGSNRSISPAVDYYNAHPIACANQLAPPRL